VASESDGETRIHEKDSPVGDGCRLTGSVLSCDLARGRAKSHTQSDRNLAHEGLAEGNTGSVGLDEEALASFDAELASGKYMLVDSFQVFRCGTQVFARKYAHDYGQIYGKEAQTKGPLNARLTRPYNYFDPHWHPFYHGTNMHTMQSVSKTVTSVIFGVAITHGDFKAGLNTPVLKFFDVAKVKNVDDRKRRMTLKDVLSMTTGLNWNEEVPYNDPRSDSSLMEATDDWVQYVIDKPMAEEPGKSFNYSSGAAELLAYIFQKETGQDIDVRGEISFRSARHKAPLEA
jgi:hypothetical protein